MKFISCINLKNHCQFSIFISSLLLSHLVIAEEVTPDAKTFKPISAYSAQYQLKSSKYKISTKANRKLSITKENIASLEQNASIFVAKIDQKSTFTLSNSSCEIVAQSYTFNQTVFGKKKDYRIYFDYPKKQFIESANQKESINEIKGKLYDELSYQEALRCALKNKSEIKIGQEFSYIVRTKGKNRHYDFVVSNFEKLTTDIGEVNSVQLSRIRSSEKDNNDSHIWFSADHDYLLIKFRQQDDDDTYSLDIKNLQLSK